MTDAPYDPVALSKHEHLAVTIVQALQEAGFIAYFAGGWVRDFLMQTPCQDIDIATSAHPEEVIRLFPRSVTVGVQFGVVRVLMGEHEFEVASFRSDDQYVDGRRPERVDLHGCPETDACRRDFTINGMFYDPIQKRVLDFVGGEEDIRRRVIRTIGPPRDRFREDRLRIIRAIRFKNILNFSIDQETWEALCLESVHVAESVSPERIWQELQKMARKHILAAGLRDMADGGLLQVLFPCLQKTEKAALDTRLTAIGSYSGESVIAALCLLFQGEAAYYLEYIGDAYHLSRRERKIIELFASLGGLQQKRSESDLAKLYARSEFEEYLLAAACLHDDPEKFLELHRQQYADLSFWIDQVRTKSYLVTGDDLKQLGLQSGTEMGRLLEKAFDLSIKYRLRTKEEVLAKL